MIEDLQTAAAITGTVTVLTLVEDVLTSGAGVADDLPSIFGGEALARFILAI